MPKLPILSANAIIKILKKLGFKEIRQKGSHVFFSHEDGRTTVIPVHQGEDIGRGLLAKIIKEDIKLSIQDFLDLLK